MLESRAPETATSGQSNSRRRDRRAQAASAGRPRRRPRSTRGGADPTTSRARARDLRPRPRRDSTSTRPRRQAHFPGGTRSFATSSTARTRSRNPRVSRKSVACPNSSVGQGSEDQAPSHAATVSGRQSRLVALKSLHTCACVPDPWLMRPSLEPNRRHHDEPMEFATEDAVPWALCRTCL